MTAALAAERIEVTGVVQGVGFRPFVHRLADELGLAGRVGNNAAHVFIEITGPAPALDRFARRLVTDAPPLARIEGVARAPAAPSPAGGFRIVDSESADGGRTFVSPDTAVCEACLAELFDPADRRYRHPFITCTNCGPRFTITRRLPYDRPQTTMGSFPLCVACDAEYRDQTDRRHHAQPVCCHDCGPVVTLRSLGPGGKTLGTGEVALAGALAAIEAGLIVAVKGLGGYHLACDASSDEALTILRRRKHRPDKPLAVMVADLDAASELAHISGAESQELRSSARPIVLVEGHEASPLSNLVAPGNPLLGLMLPYTPIHHLLFADGSPALAMTSANHGGEPIAHRDDDIDTRLAPLADLVLTHDRPIHVPCDDSVVRVVGGRLLPIRRARGYAPLPVAMKGAGGQVLAVGGELKNTFCVTSGDQAWVSQHLGDMGNVATLDAFEAGVAQFSSFYSLTPEVVAVDAHPEYLTTRWARTTHPGRLHRVQHHHAHIAAVMAENQLDPAEPVIGFAFDGTGYGDDDAIWGGELLIADGHRFERHAHLAYVPLPGGDAAIGAPSRVALAHLSAAGIEWLPWIPSVADIEGAERALLRRQLESGYRCVPTSSMGRLFDAVASLLGLRHRISFEAQAAIDLEIAASRSDWTGSFARFTVAESVIDPTAVLASIVDDLGRGEPVDDIALRFHLAVADVVRAMAERVRSERGLETVVLSGGVFQNALLTECCLELLHSAGFEPLTHRLVPPNDGGLALGQAFIATHRDQRRS